MFFKIFTFINSKKYVTIVGVKKITRVLKLLIKVSKVCSEK